VNKLNIAFYCYHGQGLSEHPMLFGIVCNRTRANKEVPVWSAYNNHRELINVYLVSVLAGLDCTCLSSPMGLERK